MSFSINQTHDTVATSADGWSIHRASGHGMVGSRGFAWYLRRPDGKTFGFDKKAEISKWFVEAGKVEPRWNKA